MDVINEVMAETGWYVFRMFAGIAIPAIGLAIITWRVAKLCSLHISEEDMRRAIKKLDK